MGQLTDAERLEIAISLLGNGVKRDMYHRLCTEREQDCERDACDDCPYYDEVACICKSPTGCLNEGVTDDPQAK